MLKASLEATIKAKETSEAMVAVLQSDLRAMEMHLAKKESDLQNVSSQLQLLESSSALE